MPAEIAKIEAKMAVCVSLDTKNEIKTDLFFTEPIAVYTAQEDEGEEEDEDEEDEEEE